MWIDGSSDWSSDPVVSSAYAQESRLPRPELSVGSGKAQGPRWSKKQQYRAGWERINFGRAELRRFELARGIAPTRARAKVSATRVNPVLTPRAPKSVFRAAAVPTRHSAASRRSSYRSRRLFSASWGEVSLSKASPAAACFFETRSVRGIARTRVLITGRFGARSVPRNFAWEFCVGFLRSVRSDSRG